MFGDNKSVVTSSAIPHSTLSKRWNALSCHRVREAIASGWLRFHHIPGTQNPADVLTKPMTWGVMRVFVEPMLFWKGDAKEAKAPRPSGGGNPEGSNAGPGLAQTRDSVETVTDVNRDTRGDAGIAGAVAANVLWNNQYAVLAGEDD